MILRYVLNKYSRSVCVYAQVNQVHDMVGWLFRVQGSCCTLAYMDQTTAANEATKWLTGSETDQIPYQSVTLSVAEMK